MRQSLLFCAVFSLSVLANPHDAYALDKDRYEPITERATTIFSLCPGNDPAAIDVNKTARASGVKVR